MKSKFIALLLAFTFVTGLSLVTDAQAYWRHRYWYGPGYYHPYYYGPGYYHHYHHYRNCGWVPGHWFRGVWYPGHRSCWY